MSDTQSDNTDWARRADVGRPLSEMAERFAERTPLLANELAQAEFELEHARDELWRAEEALQDAKRAHTKAGGKVWLLKDKPTWRDIFAPRVQPLLGDLYTLCMQLGFSYAVYNNKIYRAGQPGDGMIDTGCTIEDIK